MERITDVTEFKMFITNRKLHTNCVDYYTLVLDWFLNGEIDAYQIGGNLFIFRIKHNSYRFYYYVEKMEKIRLATTILEKYRQDAEIALNYICKNMKGMDRLTKVILPLNFKFYKEYARLLPKTVEAVEMRDQEVTDYDSASIEDTDELLKIMFEDFDPITDELPTRAELITLIKQGAVIVKKIDEQIVLIQIYEVQKNLIYSRMTWIQKEYRKPQYTFMLHSVIDAFFRKLNVKDGGNLRRYGWIDKANRNYKINIKLGSVPDGITSTTFLYK